MPEIALALDNAGCGMEARVGTEEQASNIADAASIAPTGHLRISVGPQTRSTKRWMIPMEIENTTENRKGCAGGLRGGRSTRNAMKTHVLTE